jgi:hypothetical protein
MEIDKVMTILTVRNLENNIDLLVFVLLYNLYCSLKITR